MSDYDKMIFAKNLCYYMELSGKKQTDIADYLGVSKSTVSDWCKGNMVPRMGKIEKLANYFGILKSDLIEEKKPATNDELEKKLIEDFRKVPDENKDLLLDMVKVFLKKHQ